MEAFTSFNSALHYFAVIGMLISADLPFLTLVIYRGDIPVSKAAHLGGK